MPYTHGSHELDRLVLLLYWIELIKFVTTDFRVTCGYGQRYEHSRSHQRLLHEQPQLPPTLLLFLRRPLLRLVWGGFTLHRQQLFLLLVKVPPSADTAVHGHDVVVVVVVRELPASAPERPGGAVDDPVVEVALLSLRPGTNGTAVCPLELRGDGCRNGLVRMEVGIEVGASHW